MASIDIYKTESKAIEAEETRKKIESGEIEPEKESLSLASIMQDKEKTDLLGKMIDEEGNPDGEALMTRLLNKKLEPGDVAKLDEYRERFSGKLEKAENINSEITTEMLADIGALHPDFQKIIKQADSPEKAATMIKGQMNEVAMTDPTRFAHMTKEVEALQSFKKGEFKRVYTETQELAKKMGVDTNQYMKTLAIKDEKERDKKLAGLVRASWGDGIIGSTRRGIDSITSLFGGSLSKAGAKELAEHKWKIDAAFTQLELHKKKIGEVLAATVEGNPQMREALAKSILGEPVKKENPVGIKEAKGMFTYDEEAVADEWTREKSKLVVGGKKWKDLTEYDRQEQRKQFTKRIKDRAGKKSGATSGMFTRIFLSFFQGLVDSKMSALSLD